MEKKILWATGDAGIQSPVAVRLGEMIAQDKPDRFLYLGDVYQNGLYEEYLANYHPYFGSFKDQTWPILGNHDWGNRRKTCPGYKEYWNGLPCWYANEYNGWLFLLLDSESPCGLYTPQHDFVNSQIRNLKLPIICCTHRPRWSAGTAHDHGDQEVIQPLTKLLSEHPCLYISGHEHSLQALKPIHRSQQLIAGSGGHYDRHTINFKDPCLLWGTLDHGALRLELTPELCYYEFRGLDGNVLHSGTWLASGKLA